MLLVRPAVLLPMCLLPMRYRYNRILPLAFNGGGGINTELFICTFRVVVMVAPTVWLPLSVHMRYRNLYIYICHAEV